MKTRKPNELCLSLKMLKLALHKNRHMMLDLLQDNMDCK